MKSIWLNARIWKTKDVIITKALNSWESMALSEEGFESLIYKREQRTMSKLEVIVKSVCYKNMKSFLYTPNLSGPGK